MKKKTIAAIICSAVVVLLLASCSMPWNKPELDTYTGSLFSIKYAKTWKAHEEKTGVKFEDETMPAMMYSVQVIKFGAGASLNAKSSLESTLNGLKSSGTNYKEEKKDSTTIGKTTFQRAVVTADVTEGGKTANIRFTALIAVEDVNGVLVQIIYGCESKEWGSMESDYFTPMTESFVLK